MIDYMMIGGNSAYQQYMPMGRDVEVEFRNPNISVNYSMLMELQHMIVSSGILYKVNIPKLIIVLYISISLKNFDYINIIFFVARPWLLFYAAPNSVPTITSNAASNDGRNGNDDRRNDANDTEQISWRPFNK